MSILKWGRPRSNILVSQMRAYLQFFVIRQGKILAKVWNNCPLRRHLRIHFSLVRSCSIICFESCLFRYLSVQYKMRSVWGLQLLLCFLCYLGCNVRTREAPTAFWKTIGAPATLWKTIEAPTALWKTIEAPTALWKTIEAPATFWETSERPRPPMNIWFGHCQLDRDIWRDYLNCEQ